MRRFLIILLLCSSAFGQWQSGVKPMLGVQVDGASLSSKGLVAYWLFNEGSGNIVSDLSGSGIGGTFYNDTTWSSGKYGSSVIIDGTADFIDYGRQISLELVSNFTVVISVNPSNISQYDCFFVNCTQGGRGWRIWTRDSSSFKWYFECYDGANKNTISTNAIVLNQEQQLVCVHDGTNINLYLNGQPTGTPTGCGDLDYVGTTDARLMMGDMLETTDWPNVRGRNPATKYNYAMIYNRALSASEIAELYREPFGMFVKDDIVILATAAEPPPPPSGQVITIIMTSIPLFLIPFFFIKRRKLRR